jgi:hypothetical protein
VASYSVEGLPDFSFSEALHSFRELLAIDRMLAHMESSPEGSLRPSEWTTLWWLTDNQNVEKMLASQRVGQAEDHQTCFADSEKRKRIELRHSTDLGQ